jgi:competence protein ComEC
VRSALSGATGAIGAALIVGEQRAIPESAAEPLRASGLTHIVSISGLHMSLVAGGVIVAIRALLALFPALALRRPIRKWAAAAAFVAATVYLLLSGMQVAALRSHLMLSVALLAVMVDRPAITMHTVAVSAALILAVDPSSVMDPSFQMSYLAVIALVACYDLYRAWAAKRPPPAREDGLIGHLAGATLRHFEGFAVSSLIAGLATDPVIAAVFFRAAPYSILANMAVLPVTGLVIMPAAVVAVLAMPFGLDPWPLAVMGLGIDWMVAVGGWAAALPGGAGVIGASHPAMMPLGIAAVLWVSAWRSRIRLLGLVPALAAVILVFLGPRPDVMIGRHGSPIAVRGDDGRLHVLATRQDRFDTAIWLAADADPRDPAAPGLAEGWTCDPLGCVFTLPSTPDATVSGAGGFSRSATEPAPDAGSGIGGATVTSEATLHPSAPDAVRPRLEIAVVRHPDAFAEDCRRAALVISTLIAPPGCRDHTTVVDRIDLARTGASSLFFTGPVDPVYRRSLRTEAASAPSPAPSVPAVPSAAVVDPTSDLADPPGEDPSGEARGEDRRPAVLGSEAPEEAEIEADPPTLRRAVAITSALPRPPRPWTPVDPRIERLAREADEAEAFAADAEARLADPPPLSSDE